MKTFTTPEQRMIITQEIEKALTRRGFHVSIRIQEELAQIKTRNILKVESDEFQTTPVLFESIRIENFSSGFFEHEKKRGFIIQIHAMYKHFNGGQNGVELFTIRGYLAPDRLLIYNVTIE